MIRGPPKNGNSLAKRSRLSSGTFKRTASAPVMKIYRPPGYGKNPGLPDQMKVTLKYAETIAVVLTSGVGKYVFSCNGIYDPNITGIGHQPMYFDQLMPLYDHYVVTASKCKVSFPTGYAADMIVCLFIDDDASVPTAISACAERGDSTTICGASQVAILPPIYKSWKHQTAFGQNVMANTDLHGTIAANPNEQSYYVLSVSDLELNSRNFTSFWELTYEVTFFERADVAQS